MGRLNIMPIGMFGLLFYCPSCGKKQHHNVRATLNRVLLPCQDNNCGGWIMVALNWAITYGTNAAVWHELGLCQGCLEGRLLNEFDEDGRHKLTCTVCTDPKE